MTTVPTKINLGPKPQPKPEAVAGRPLPPGSVSKKSPEELAKMTPLEQRHVLAQSGQAMPAAVRQQAERLAMEDKAAFARDVELQATAAANRVAAGIDVQDIGALPPEKQAETQQTIAAMLAKAKQQEGFSDLVKRGLGEPEGGRKVGIDIKEQAEEQPAPLLPNGGAAVGLDRCPHCNWDLKLSDGFEVDNQDKWNFLQAMMGDQLFHKAYPLYAGQLSVVFRQLRFSETTAISNHIMARVKSGEIQDRMHQQVEVNKFRLYLQLASVTKGGAVQALPASLADWDAPAGSDKLALIEQHMMENVIRSESAMHVLIMANAQFNRLVNVLEARSADENFFKGIGQPG